LKTKDIVLVALFAALIVVLSLMPPIPVPVVPVPLTLGVMLAGLVLGPRRGALAVTLYVALALLGIPVLPGGRAGLAVLAGPTAGFLLGMIPGAAVTGWLAGSPQPAASRSAGLQVFRCWLAAAVGSMGVVYLVGIPWMAMVAGMDPAKAIWAMVVFIPGDLIKALLAAVIAQRVRLAVATV
jgi:biotin transport system substrate-specific component